MIRLLRIVLCTLLFAVIISGCTFNKMRGKGDVNKENINPIASTEVTASPLATKGFLMDIFQVSEDELDKYNTEEVIVHFALTEDFLYKRKKI